MTTPDLAVCPECQHPVERSDPAWIEPGTDQLHHDPCPPTPTAATTGLAEVLAAHFVMWHELDGDGPPGEWRCACGLKFGFSDSAIDHQAEQITAHLAARLSDPDVVEAAAKAMHDTYEAQAVHEGWETNPASRVGWDDLPAANRNTMLVAVRAAFAAAAGVIS